MRKFIALISLLCVTTMAFAGGNFWIKNKAGKIVTEVKATTTDTTQQFDLGYAENAVLEIFVDEVGSSTFTVELDILAPRSDGTLFVVRDTTAIISAATADTYSRLILRRPGLLGAEGLSQQYIASNIIALKRVLTLNAGDSIYVHMKLSTW
jgi:hypothetical protein